MKTYLSLALALALALALVCAGCTSRSETPAQCTVGQDSVRFYRGSSAAYLFDRAGMTVYKGGAHYQLLWPDIRELDGTKTVWFGKSKEDIKKTEISLSVASRRRDTPLKEDIGLLDNACWNSLLQLLERNHVGTIVSMQLNTVDDPIQPQP